MKDKESERIFLEESTIIIGQAFSKEIKKIPYDGSKKGQIFITQHELWNYKKVTTLRE